MNIKSMFASLPRMAAVLGVTTIPAAGWLREVWSAETAMLLYYLETAAVVLLVGLMVRLAVPAADEHGRPIAGKRNRMTHDYWLVMGGFVAVIGVFLAVFFFLFMHVPVDWRAVGATMLVIVALQIFGYGWEAYRLRPLDIADAEHLISRDMSRVVVLHLGVFFGTFLAAVRAEWFVWPFIILKILVDVGTVLEQVGGRGRAQTDAARPDVRG